MGVTVVYFFEGVDACFYVWLSGAYDVYLLKRPAQAIRDYFIKTRLEQ